jgi:hypothetical protein
MADAFQIKIFVPDGDPEGLRIISRMDWARVGIAFPRSKWPDIRQRSEFSCAGVYILDPDSAKTYKPASQTPCGGDK